MHDKLPVYLSQLHNKLSVYVSQLNDKLSVYLSQLHDKLPVYVSQLNDWKEVMSQCIFDEVKMSVDFLLDIFTRTSKFGKTSWHNSIMSFIYKCHKQ